jgi:hypothetical protein
MFSLTKRVSVAAVLGLGVLALTGTRAQAQSPYFLVRPGLTIQQAAFNTALLGQALQNIPPYFYGINPYPRVVVNSLAGGYSGYANPYVTPYASLYSSPYGAGTNGYGSAYGSSYPYYDPESAYLGASASVIKEQGEFMVKQQQALRMYEQVRNDRVENRRRTFDQYLYERDKTPTAEQERQRNLKEQLDRSRNNPPITEVYSAKALNDLLAELRANQGEPALATLRTVELPLPESVLNHINVTKGNGNPGLFKNEGRLTWPVALTGSEFKDERERVDALAQKAVGQASWNGQVNAGTIRELSNGTDLIKKELRRTGGELSPSRYIEANRFLNSLNDAIKALEHPDASNFFTGKYLLKGKTVPELVNFMTEHGLQFAAAVPGDEAAYLAIHQALTTYDRAAQVQTAARPSR